MAKVRTTLVIDREVLTALTALAVRTGRGESEVIESAVRRDLGFDLLDRLSAKSDLSEDDAMEQALEAQQSVRAQKN